MGALAAERFTDVKGTFEPFGVKAGAVVSVVPAPFVELNYLSLDPARIPLSEGKEAEADEEADERLKNALHGVCDKNKRGEDDLSGQAEGLIQQTLSSCLGGKYVWQNFSRGGNIF